jgi:hypothetical protein
MSENIPLKIIESVRSAWKTEISPRIYIRIEELTHDWIIYQLVPPKSYTEQSNPDTREQIILKNPSQYSDKDEDESLWSVPLGSLRLVVPKNGKNWFLLTSGEVAHKEYGVGWEYDVTVESCPNPSEEVAAILSKHLYRPNPESIRALNNDDLEAFLRLEQIVHPPVDYTLRILQSTPFHLGMYNINKPIYLIKALKPYQVQISLVRPNDSGGYHSNNVS